MVMVGFDGWQVSRRDAQAAYFELEEIEALACVIVAVIWRAIGRIENWRGMLLWVSGTLEVDLRPGRGSCHQEIKSSSRRQFVREVLAAVAIAAV